MRVYTRIHYIIVFMRVERIQNNYRGKSGQNRVAFRSLATKFADAIPESLLKSKKIHSFFKLAEKNASLFDVTTALLMGVTLGAGGILASPFRKKDERQYMASQLIMNCVVSFLLPLVIYLPMAKAISKLGDKAVQNCTKKGVFPYKKGSKEYDSFNYLVNYGSRFIIAPLQSFLIIKGITPTFKKLFEKKEVRNEN